MHLSISGAASLQWKQAWLQQGIEKFQKYITAVVAQFFKNALDRKTSNSDINFLVVSVHTMEPVKVLLT